MKLLHTMLRVVDLKKSIYFYTEILGMMLLRKKDYPSGRFTLAFVGFGSENDTSVLELTHNWDIDHYQIGILSPIIKTTNKYKIKDLFDNDRFNTYQMCIEV